MDTTLSLYEQLGGAEGITKVVDRFYKKVLADGTINHFFQNTDMEKQAQHQALFISWVTGGPNQYTGQSMTKAHEGMNLSKEHFQAVAKHLAESLREFGVGETQIHQVLDKLESMQGDILHK